MPCGNSKHYRNIKEYLPLRSCRRGITSHLQRLKTSQTNIKGEWQLILLRAGLFDEDGETLTICPLYRDSFGTIWNSSRPVTKCHHPLHVRVGAKSERGISLDISKEIQVYRGVLVPIGSGICIRVDPVVRQLNIPWKKAAPSTKRYYRQKGKEIVEVALHCLTPGQAIELLSELMNYMEKRERRKSADTGVSEISRLIKLPNFVQDVAYVTKTLKLLNGEKMEIPNVVRTVIASRIVDLYQQYCQETGFFSLGGVNLLKYFTNKSSAWVQDVKDHLKAGKAGKSYLKTNFQIHLTEESQRADHCRIFALSDPEDHHCEYEHMKSCQSCDNIQNVLDEIELVLSSGDLHFSRTLASTFLTPERIPCMALCTNIRPSYIPSKKNLEGLSQKECMEYPTAEPGWALKKNKKTGRFSEYVKEYLLKQAVFDG
ncbi:hypothetical protein AWC38_SpisGene17466 [Stylophora pistillata]|uniref:Uncharacterized protein n=1 Tax=Stylophora pistillata TaxID=50429 RepID=A0A2B4RMY2_STYPI|nr:hypothetical protein AWC38_SpisGene17466 [Stylophora pistillata]